MRIFGVIVALWLAIGPVARAGEVDDRLARAAKIEVERDQLERERAALKKTYEDKAAAVDALKAAPASWSRDRKLQALLAESHDMAAALDRDDERIGVLEQAAAAEDKALVAAIDVELAAQSDPARTAVLRQKRNEIRARQAAAARRLKIADETIAPGDDATDLDYKAGALAKSESQLLAESQRLVERAARYHKLAGLAKSRQRADEHDVFRDEDARLGNRGSTKSAGESAGHDTGPSANTGSGAGGPPLGPTGGGPTGGGTATPATALDLGVDPSLVLADVVGSPTLDELRKAEQSGDPEARARAAERAQKELSERIQRVHQRRLEMEKRARELRGAP